MVQCEEPLSWESDPLASGFSPAKQPGNAGQVPYSLCASDFAFREMVLPKDLSSYVCRFSYMFLNLSCILSWNNVMAAPCHLLKKRNKHTHFKYTCCLQFQDFHCGSFWTRLLHPRLQKPVFSVYPLILPPNPHLDPSAEFNPIDHHLLLVTFPSLGF